jgi:superfamily II DNA or RNA helicase|tara:strand:- start:969 stop:3107 length:2139 start_codon:yes stop_codon:yes gene_type:complete
MAKKYEDDSGRINKPSTIPPKWEMLQGIDLYDWQISCVTKWFDSGRRGVVKVVTGAGKTILAMAIIQKLQNKDSHDLRVAIVVPTIVLLGQWYDAILEYSNLPAESLGRLGGGYSDEFSKNTRILISVLPSASKQLSSKTIKGVSAKDLLLIVDECHRSGAEKMSRIFLVDRAFSLGLSATPERDDTPEAAEESYDVVKGKKMFHETLIGKELGPIIYELTFADAIKRGILPRFEICHYGLLLENDENVTYKKYSRDIPELKKALRNSSKKARSLDGGAFIRWARKVSSKGNSKSTKLASNYLHLISERKQLLYKAKARQKAVIELLRKEFSDNPDARVILFHESIDEVERLFQLIRDEGSPVVAEHSKLANKLRARNIELFRKGIKKVLVSGRSLVEGFDVPAADVGIIVASSSSVRQRIQTLGRILRRHKDSYGEQKHSVLHVLYMAKTVDERIYEKNNWDEEIGAGQNRYFLWNPEVEKKAEPQTDPPRRPLPAECEIEWEKLKPGDVYPGRYEGEEYTCDTKGNVFNMEGRLASNPQGLVTKIIAIKGAAGKFRVTRRKKAVLVRVKVGDEWVTRFVCFLETPFDFDSAYNAFKKDGPTDVKNLKPGDKYPGFINSSQEYFIKRRANGVVISKKVKRGRINARINNEAKDKVMGRDAERLIDSVLTVEAQKGVRISKILVNDQNHAFSQLDGNSYFLCSLEKGLEFPE